MSKLMAALMPLHASLERKIEVGSLIELQKQVSEWQAKKFPDQPVEGKCKHLAREAKELGNAPRDEVEMADCLLLLLGIAQVGGVSIERLVAVAWGKFEHNKTRQWGPPDEDGVCHHIEDQDYAGEQCEAARQERRAA